MSVVRNILVTAILASLLTIHAGVSAQEMMAEVYRDENVLVRASLLAPENATISLGDILSLAVEIVYDESRIRLQQTGDAFFTGSWPQSIGAYLLEHQTSLESVDGNSMQQQNLFKFQILGCPDGVMSCKGERRYQIPEFMLQYHLIEQTEEAGLRMARFIPEPVAITVLSMLEPDEDGELLAFSAYFPTGAYPDPLVGNAQTGLYSGLIAGGVFLLLGGILMSPLSLFRRKAFVPKARPRWQLVLEQLQAGKFEQEEMFLDELRRSLVWYCVDELAVEPFYWVKHQEEVSAQQQQGSEKYADLEKLFIELLHSPPGQGKALLERFQSLIKK